jgi:hypothetical protein
MKTTSLLAILLLGGAAHAEGLDGLHDRLQTSAAVDGATGGVEVFSTHAHAGQGVCFAPLGDTVADAGTLHCSMSGLGQVATPVFRRESTRNSPEWTVDVSAALKRSAWHGNALFAFYDADDEGAVESDRYAALYQAEIGGGKAVAAHVHLAPESGFSAGHTYHLRIAQLIKGETIVLAEGDLRLE